MNVAAQGVTLRSSKKYLSNIINGEMCGLCLSVQNGGNIHMRSRRGIESQKSLNKSFARACGIDRKNTNKIELT